MTNFIRDLWRGRIYPAEMKSCSKKTYVKIGEIARRIDKANEILAERLDEESLLLLKQMDSDIDELAGLSEEEGFAKGCSFMSKLLLSALSEEK